jgi:hypothetical protein
MKPDREACLKLSRDSGILVALGDHQPGCSIDKLERLIHSAWEAAEKAAQQQAAKVCTDFLANRPMNAPGRLCAQEITICLMEKFGMHEEAMAVAFERQRKGL